MTAAFCRLISHSRVAPRPSQNARGSLCAAKTRGDKDITIKRICRASSNAIPPPSSKDDFANKKPIRLREPSQSTTPKTKWIGFDLDDTLHRFTPASQKAATKVFEHIINSHPDLTMGRLSDQYKQICKEYVTSFTDGRSSRSYRSERMQQLLKRSGISTTSADELVDIYAAGLAESLELEDGASDVLRKIKGEGLNVAVITEGPHDAQEWTIKKLGLSKMIDRLITSNKERISKKNGLFDVFIERTRAQASECFVVGDSIDNDILPANKSGIKTIYFDPKNKGPDEVATHRVSHLKDLLKILHPPGDAG